MARSRMQAPRTTRHGIVYLCFFFSGLAGLIYEVVWARQLSLFLGITAYANTAVITAYMIGLAAGGFLLGRLADRTSDSLRLYAWLEIGIGAYAATTPWLFGWMQSIYASTAGTVGITGTSSHLLRFLLALLVLLWPTFLMGGTLPLLVRGLTGRLPQLGCQMGRLYGLNTLGAAIGTFAAGYLLLPQLGLRGTTALAVLLNLAVAITILGMRRRFVVAARSPKAPATRQAVAQRSTGSMHSGPETPERGDLLTHRAAILLLIGFGLSGFAALIYEIAWIRALTLVIGSSVYAFSTTLATYLVGLGLGSLLYARVWGDRTGGGPSLRRAARLEGGIAASAVLGLLLIGRLPEFFLDGYAAGLHESFALFQLFIFILCFLVMIVPTLLLGMLFPLLTALWTTAGGKVGRGVGTAYAANTAGTVLGAALGGLLLLPILGVQNSLILAAGLHVVTAVLFGSIGPSQQRTFSRVGETIAGVAVFCLLVWLIPPWDRVVMTSGTFVNAEYLLADESGNIGEREARREILYYAEGIDGVVSVEANQQERFLVINGKDDASGHSDLPTQVLLGELPMLIHPDPRMVLVIGLGSGITVGSVAAHESAKRIDVLEISPEVVTASGFFAEEHGDVLSDRRVDLIVADARNFVLASEELYDVITSEPSNPWISGISNLFTRDFFDLAARRLAPGGLMAQWLETYNMSNDDVRSVLETFHSVFPNVTVWMPMLGDLILIGTRDPHHLDFEPLEALLEQPRIQADLERIGLGDPAPLLSTFLLGSDRVASYARGASINSDEHPRIEFHAPRYLYANLALANLIDIVHSTDNAMQKIPVSGLAQREGDRILAPGLGLELTLDREDWNVAWEIGRSIVTGEDRSDQLSMTSRRALSVRDSLGEIWVEAAHVSHEATPEELGQTLATLLESPISADGVVRLCRGESARWAASTGENQALSLALAWSVPNRSNLFTRYLVVDHRKGFEDVDPSREAQELAGRICVTRREPVGAVRRSN